MISAYLRRDGFQVLEARSGLEALLGAAPGRPSTSPWSTRCFPEIDGLELVRRVRRESTVPIIMLAAGRDEAARIAALEAGADDYVVKPLSMPEVTARMRAQLRRARGFETEQTVLRTGELELDLDARRCCAGSRAVKLPAVSSICSPRCCATRVGIHTREQLLELVWGTDAISPKTVDVHVAPLRRKLGSATTIATLRGLGIGSIRPGRRWWARAPRGAWARPPVAAPRSS